jgi:PAS domain S-box-containing protein
LERRPLSDRYFELSSDLLCTAGFDGYFKQVNPAWTDTLGLTESELLSQPCIDFVHPDDREGTLAATTRLTEAPTELVGFRNRYRTGDGSYRWLEWNSKTVPGEDLIYATARDITAQHDAAQSVRRSEAFMNSVLENLPNMVFVKDAEELKFVQFNRASENLLGFSRAEMIGKSDYDFFPQEQAELFAAKDREVLASGEVLDIPEELVQTKAGERRLLHTRKVAIRDEDGNPSFLIGVSVDITERRDAEDRFRDLGISEDITERREAEERFRDLLEAAPDATVIVDEEGKIMLVNAQTERLFGYEHEELVGEPVERLVPIGFATVNGDAGLHAQNPRTQAMGVGPDLSARRKDGSEFPVEISRSPMEVEEGTLITAAIRDVTDRKRVEEAGEAARLDAEHANMAKSEFLSRMSHELRTPLNSILGFGQLLEMDRLEEGQRESVGQIMKGGRHLLVLIDEVLDISRIESGNLGISLEPVHLGSVLAEALSLIAPLAAQAGVRLKGDPSDFEDWYVRADQQRLNQVLLNLFANGVKYNQEGGEVRVECRRMEDRVEVAVVDTGRGMTAEQLEHLFQPFDRLGAERTEIEGTGLGLALSKALVEAMGGTIVARSEPGGGTTVVIELEGAEPPTDEGLLGVSIGPAAATARRTVVYVEDNLSNLKLVQGALSRLPDVRLIPAMQGELGLDLIREHRPDLVLLDLHLPDIPGTEVLEKLQADPATRGIPVVVVSADATASQVKRLLAAGASEYLTKPLDVRRLLELVATPPAEREG